MKTRRLEKNWYWSKKKLQPIGKNKLMINYFFLESLLLIIYITQEIFKNS